MATTKRCKTGKRQFHSEKQAKKVITSARQSVEQGKQEGGYIPARAYKCPSCHRWHLTSESKQTPFPYDARRLVVRCLAMTSPTQTPTGFVAGWNQPGHLPESEPETFDTFLEAVEYIRGGLIGAYEAQLDAAGGERFYTTDRMRDTIGALSRLTDDDTQWSSGEALAGLLYWINPVTPAD